ncbi:MAG TPA: glycosyltransferase family 4 protein [Candidatus Deferrimicrobium sp.]|nr:glycosyltransferase family 4 protein [Candidatus Deferrimicrobium sp.]
MNIGYIVQQGYPYSYGSGIHAFELAKELTKLGHELHIITKGEPNQSPYEKFKDVHLHRILSFLPTPYYFPLNPLLLWREGKKIIDKLQLDLLIGHGFEASLFFRMRKKVPFIYKAAGTIELQKLRQFLTWHDIIGKVYFPVLGRLEKMATLHANSIIAISDTIKQELIEIYKIPMKKIQRIYNGVDVERFKPSRNKLSLKRKMGLDARRVILFVGRLSPIKGPQLLLQAIPLVLRKFPDVFFVFIGDGPLSSYLQVMIQKLHVGDSVKLLGFKSNIKMPNYFAMADICVIPSMYEPFGLVSLESLASGTPILTSNVGGLAEVHRILNILPTISPLTPFNIAIQLNNLLAQPEKIEQLGQKGRKLVSQYFTWKQCAENTNKFIEKLRKK